MSRCRIALSSVVSHCRLSYRIVVCRIAMSRCHIALSSVLYWTLARRDARQCDTTLDNAIRHSTTRYDTRQCDTTFSWCRIALSYVAYGSRGRRTTTRYDARQCDTTLDNAIRHFRNVISRCRCRPVFGQNFSHADFKSYSSPTPSTLYPRKNGVVCI